MIIILGFPVIGYGNKPASLKLGERVKGVMVSPESNTQHLGRIKPEKIDEYYIAPKNKSLDEAISENKIVVFPEDYLEYFPDPKLGLGSHIKVYRATEVILNDTGRKLIYRTWTKTVGQFLEEKKILIGQDDILETSRVEKIRQGLEIKLRRADDTVMVENFEIPFQVIVKEDSWLPQGKVKIMQQGEAGQRNITWRVIRRDGVEIKRFLLRDEVVSASIERLVHLGTKPVTFKGPYYDWIKEAATKYGADPNAMFRVMMCESGGDPYALSPKKKYHGLFQYDDLTWSVSGWGDHSIFDPFAQINAAAKAWDSRYTKWPVTSRICGDLGKKS